MEKLKETRAEDEELVAIVENDACGVDALLCITGCTFGKGNLIFHDYGKHVYTIYSRSSRSGVRVVFHDKGIPDNIHENRAKLTEWILSAPEENIVSITSVKVTKPEPARIRKSVPCSFCGESVMETRLKTVNGMPACIPCAEK